MKILKNTLFIVGLLALNTAQAVDEKIYVETGYISATYREPLLWFTHGMAALRIGYQFNNYFSVEGQFATALTNAAGYVGSTYVTAKIDNSYGLNLKLQTEPSNGMSVYGKLGMNSGTVSAATSYGSVWAGGTSPTYGLGAKYEADRIYYSFEYMSFYAQNGVTITGPSLNLGYKF